MSDQEDQPGDNGYNTNNMENNDDDDVRPHGDVTPPIDQSPNVSDEREDKVKLPDKPVGRAAKLKALIKKKDKPPKAKKVKPEGKSSMEDAASKLKGMFKRKNRADTEPVEIVDDVDEPSLQIDEPPMQGPPRPFDPYPGSYHVNPSSTLTRGTPASQTARTKVASFVLRPPPNYHKEGCAEVLPPPEKSIVRCSNFIVVLLVCAFVAGVLMTALAGDSAFLKVIGPFFIGVSLFALIGKIFFTLFWTKEAHPMLKPAAKAINRKIRSGPNYQQRQDPMKAYSYPKSAAYNQAYDQSQTSPVHGDLGRTSQFMNEADFTPYIPPTTYHEEPMQDDNYQYDYDKQDELGDYRVDINDD